MSFPEIKQPTFTITIPSTGKKVKFRRFVTGEEKILLFAKETNEKTAITQALIDIIESCVCEPLDVYSLKGFDVDYVFLQLRAQSVDNIVTFRYLDPKEEEEPIEVSMNLNEVEAPVVIEASKVIDLDGNISIEVEYPTVNQTLKILEQTEDLKQISDLMVAASIKRVFDKSGEEFQADSEEEIFKFIDSFPPKPYGKLVKYLNDTPQLKHKLSYKDHAGEQQEVVLNGVVDFFTF